MPKKQGARRYPRSDREILQALARHLTLLHEYEQAFEKGDERFLGEVAGKLRVLCYGRGRNRPLLLDLMKKYRSSVQVKCNTPPNEGELVPLEEYLSELEMKYRARTDRSR